MEVREAPDPTPGPGEVRIAVEAAGVNFADIMARTGLYPDAPPFPFVVGYEVAGTIDAVGEGVDPARMGQGVLAMLRFGGYSSAVVVPALQAIRRPVGLSAADAAAIPVVYLTAWMMLKVMGRVAQGDRVFIHNAAGGVGLAALDLCKAAGAEVWGSAGPSKHAFLAERGVAHLLNSHTGDYPDVKMDIILDPIGGKSWAKGLAHLRAGGRLICFGMSSMNAGETRSILGVISALMSVPWLKMNPIALINDNKGVLGVNMGHLWEEGERVVGWLTEILALWESGAIHPYVHASVPFANAAEAHRIIHRRENIGKVLLVP